MQIFLLPKQLRRDGVIHCIAQFLAGLSEARAWRVTVEEAKSSRSLAQNALLWALYSQIIERGGVQMQGWEKDDLHDFFLIEHHGAERVQMFGRVKLRPARRSSTMNKQEFSDHIAFIVSFMNERGVWLDLPDAEAA